MRRHRLLVHGHRAVVGIGLHILGLGGQCHEGLARLVGRSALGHGRLRRIDEQVARQVGVAQREQAAVVEQRRIEQVAVPLLAVLFQCSVGGVEHVAVASEVHCRHVLVSLKRTCLARAVGGEDGSRVEVGHAHLLAAEVGRGAEHAVGAVGLRQTVVVVGHLVYHCRQRLVGLRGLAVAVGERLAEEQVVVGEDGHVGALVAGIDSQAHIVVVGDDAVGIDEVAVDVTRVDVGVADTARRAAAARGDVVVEALLQVEAVEVVGHGAVAEVAQSHGACRAAIAVGIGHGIVAVAYLRVAVGVA